MGERNFSPKFNEEDGHVERRSLNGLYEVENGRPRNPAGRTGLVGRGLLGAVGSQSCCRSHLNQVEKGQ